MAHTASPLALQVLVDVLAEVAGGDATMQQLQGAMEGALAAHGARSVQAARALDVSGVCVAEAEAGER